MYSYHIWINKMKQKEKPLQLDTNQFTNVTENTYPLRTFVYH